MTEQIVNVQSMINYINRLLNEPPEFITKDMKTSYDFALVQVRDALEKKNHRRIEND